MLMRQHDPLIKTLTAVLKDELESTRQMLNNFYARQFLLIAAEPWPGTQSKREKYAKLGAKILDRKRKINVIVDDLVQAAAIIHPTHQKLLNFVKTNKGPLRTLAGPRCGRSRRRIPRPLAPASRRTRQLAGRSPSSESSRIQ